MPAHDLAWLLELEELDRDLYRSRVDPTEPPRHRLYGGLVCAWALLAGAHTVADDRRPHSLHGYFLRPGKPDRPVILKVDRDRDGRSFSARHVTAVQDGEVILSKLASFHVREHSGQYETPVREPVPPPPDALEAPAQFVDRNPYLDARVVLIVGGAADGHVHNRLWLRCRGTLPDDPVLHACLVAYMSDLGTGFGELEIEDLPKGGATIDHAVWFHREHRADQWLYLDQWPIKAGGARGLYQGAMHTVDGRMVASLTQEALLRPTRG
jgi:acyl-CoA thioesterase-2